MKVFWSWQSDTPGKIGRHFVRDALSAAITRLREPPDIEEPIERETRSALHLDQDRKGVSGSPDLARVILEKIEQSSVFVADVTAVGIVPGADTSAKKLINPNVAIELGYALHALTDRALLMVMNEHYGSRADLPFDLQSKAGPILFRLVPSADRATIAAEARQLTAQFVEALQPFIEKQVERTRQERPFPQAEPKDGPGRFRAPDEPIGIRHRVIDAGAGNDIYLAPGPVLWLRLMPSFDPGQKWSSHELLTALNQGINLPTLIGPANGSHTIRAADGVGTGILYKVEDQETEYIAFAFESGEVWAISTYPLRTYRGNTVLFVDEIEKMLTMLLPYYGRFLKLIGVHPPYKWIAGVTGVMGRELQYPVAPNSMRVPGWGSQKCASDNIIVEGSYDMVQSPLSSLLPFFKEIYNKCGMARPKHLPTE